MDPLAVATHCATVIYGIQPHTIEPLPPFFDWRGIYRIADMQNHVWLLRLLHLPHADDALIQTAHLLQWLEHHHYPAPRLRLTRQQSAIGRLDGWVSLMVSYIDGAVLDVHSTDFMLLGYTLGQLHTVPLTNAALPRSRCDPTSVLTHMVQQLVQGHARIPDSVQPFVVALRESLAPLAQYTHDHCITHGDCWYKNAIKTVDNRVVLIDWDCAGIGAPILDLGYLLLTAHYDLTQPFSIIADTDKIHAILQGYQHVRQIAYAERSLMQSAVQFALAFHMGEYLEEQTCIRADDIILRKMQARFAATTDIANIALQALV